MNLLNKRIQLLKNNWESLPPDDRIVCEKIFIIADPYLVKFNQGQSISKEEYITLRDEIRLIYDSVTIQGTISDWGSQQYENIVFGILKDEVEWLQGVKSIGFYLAFGPPALNKTCLISPIIWGAIYRDIEKWRDWALQCHNEKLEVEKENSYGPIRIGLKSIDKGNTQYYYINYKPEGISNRNITFINPLHFELLMRKIARSGELINKRNELKSNTEKLK